MSETTNNCPQDCGTCGDMRCAANERRVPRTAVAAGTEPAAPTKTPTRAHKIAPAAVTASARRRNSRDCPQDCGVCGDGACGVGETPETARGTADAAGTEPAAPTKTPALARKIAAAAVTACALSTRAAEVPDGLRRVRKRKVRPNENPTNCPQDCGGCGDGSCATGEDPMSCPQDCSVCGDRACGVNEHPTTCPQDCGTCGDRTCGLFETQFSCPTDCPAAATEPADLRKPFSCPLDCRNACGDGLCGAFEDQFAAPTIATAPMRRTAVRSPENPFNCPGDCGGPSAVTTLRALRKSVRLSLRLRRRVRQRTLRPLRK